MTSENPLLPTPEPPDMSSPPPRRGGWARQLRRGFKGLVWTLLALVLILQISFVQNWLAGLATNYLSGRLESPVHVKNLRVTFFDRVLLEDFFVADYNGDTLLYARRLYADFNLNPLVLFTRGLEVEGISLYEARFNIRRGPDDPESTLDYVLRKLGAQQKRDPAAEPFSINIRNIHLQDIRVTNQDSVKGDYLWAQLGLAKAEVNELDLPNQFFNIASLRLEDPVFQLSKFRGSNWGDTLAIAEPPQAVAPPDSTRPASHLLLDELILTDGQFSLHNYRRSPIKTTPVDQLDFQHLDVYGINLDLRCLDYQRDTFLGELKHLSLYDLSGFVLNELSVRDGMVSPDGFALNGLSIRTPYSQLGDTLIFRYRGYEAFQYFTDEVRLDARISNSQVALRDILAFAPGLKTNNFFRNNRETVVQLDGRLTGQINNLRGRDLAVKLADGTSLTGDFGSRNLAVRNEEFLNLNLTQLRTSMRTLRQLIPNFNPPDNFNRLGAIDFLGRFDGFFSDFVAFGELRSDIGRARLDMRMNLKPGISRASYSGKLRLANFDLGKWSGNADFGLVDLNSEVTNGQGLTGETASAELTANIERFSFLNYDYRNATLTGKLNKNFFNGDFAIQDENIDFSFRGEVNVRDSVPKFDFTARVEHLAMLPLNLSKQDLTLAGNVVLNLRNTRFSDIEGALRLTDFELVKDQTDRYRIDSVLANSYFDLTGEKVFRIQSDIAQGEIRGAFDLGELPGALRRFFADNYPGFAARLNVKPPTRERAINRFSFDLHLIDSKGLNWLVSDKLGVLREVYLSGVYNGASDSLSVDLEAPRIKFGNLELIDVALKMDALRNEGSIDVVVDSTLLNNKQNFSRITVLSILEGDTVHFGLNYAPDKPGLLGDLNLNGILFLPDTNYVQISLSQSDLVLMADPWVINEGNAIVLGKKYLDIRNMSLQNGERRIQLEDYNHTGLLLELDNFNFTFIDDVWDYEALDFRGVFSVDARVGDIFKLTDLRATVHCDSFFINEDDFGWLTLDAETADLRSPASAYLSITRDTMQLVAEGTFNLADLGELPKTGLRPSKQRRNYFELALSFSAYPLQIADYWLSGGISDTRGSFNANLSIEGLPERPDVSGLIAVNDGAMTLNFLQTRYSFTRAFISVDNYLFNATGTILNDKFGNRAVIYGGISHNRLKDLGLSARLHTTRFLAMDLKKGDNEVFYGQAVGAGDVYFSGNFQRPDIYVDAVVADSTRIVIPVSGGADASELSLLRFVEKNPQVDAAADRLKQIAGVSLEMDLVITEKADMELIFDEQAGDIIRGNGRGNIRILLPRTGDFQMFGDYTIEQGNYLFTLYNVVNKDFRIRRGGRINWTGDPFRAQIKLEAEYKDLRAPLAGFLQEYLNDADPSLKNAANNATDVDLTLLLEGDLLQPNINFDIAFPELDGPLETFSENKLRLLKQDPNELNRQVFGLIVVGSFLPSDLSFRGTELVTNTLSEFISNQFSILLNQLFSEVVGEDKVFSGLNFDVGYNQYTSVNLENSQDLISGNEFAVTIRQNFLNDRLSVQIGGNVDFANNLAATGGAFFGNDVVLEYQLNDARTLKLRVYQQREPDIGGGRRLEFGAGLSWRKEFDTFSEFWSSLRGKVKSLGDPNS